MNIQRVIRALASVNEQLAKGPNYHGAHQLKLLRKAHAKWTKKLQEFTNPKAKPRPLPPPPSSFQRTLFTNR